jgi:hypothetical protein
MNNIEHMLKHIFSIMSSFVKRPHMFGGYGFGSKFHINSIASEFWNCEGYESTWATLGFLIEICGIVGKGKP